MPSTTDVGLESISNADKFTYESFKVMSDSNENNVGDEDMGAEIKAESKNREIVESLPSNDPFDSLKAPIMSLNNGEELDILVKMERANKEMETNNRSAQSILLSANSVGSGTANNSPPSQTLSRRTSLLSCDMVSMNDEEISWELWNQIISDWPTWSKKKIFSIERIHSQRHSNLFTSISLAIFVWS